MMPGHTIAWGDHHLLEAAPDFQRALDDVGQAPRASSRCWPSPSPCCPPTRSPIGTGGANVLKRVMGMIIAAYAVHLVFAGIGQWLHLPL
jgi:hypothetical protein